MGRSQSNNAHVYLKVLLSQYLCRTRHGLLEMPATRPSALKSSPTTWHTSDTDLGTGLLQAALAILHSHLEKFISSLGVGFWSGKFKPNVQLLI